MRSWFSRRQTNRLANRRPHSYRPIVEGLEDRTLLTAPVLDAISNVTVPQGKSLVVPVTASHDDPGVDAALSYTVSSSNPNFTAEVRRGNYLRFTVEGFGDVVFQLFDDLTPQTVAMISGLAKSGFYDGLTFHRIVNTPTPFVVQGGDPDGNGQGGPPKLQSGQTANTPEVQALRTAYQFGDEFSTSLLFTGTAQLAMANSGDDTNGSQFFITLGSPRNLDLNHTIFGQLVRGRDVLDRLRQVAVVSGTDTPVNPPRITRAAVEQNLNDAVVIVRAAPGATGTATITVTSADGADAASRTFLATAVPDLDPNTQQLINQAPFLNPIADQVTPANTAVTFTVSGQDVEGDALSFEVTQLDSPTRATVTVSGNQITVTPNSGVTGPIRLRVAVRDAAHANSASPDSETIVVAVGGQAVVPTAVALAATEGTASTNVTVATFTHGTTTNASLFTAFISWGDGKVTRGTVVVGPTAGSFIVRGTSTYDRAGRYTIRTTITQTTDGNSGIIDGTATVADAALTASNGAAISGRSGVALRDVVIANFTDANPNGRLGDYRATIDWGDGQTTDGTITQPVAGQFRVIGTHTYADPGSFTATALITSVVPPDGTQASTATASAAVTITVGPPPATDNEKFVRKLYTDLLKREGDDESVATLTDRLATGQFTREQVVIFMTSSPEYQRVEVTDLYQKYLNRAPDGSGMDVSTRFLASGGRVETLVTFLLGSDEYFQRQGGSTRDGFINAIYLDLFNRTPDTFGQGMIQLALSYRDVSRFGAVSLIVPSDEFRHQRINQLFTDLLDHDATDEARANLANAYRQGRRDEQIVTFIASSEEYFIRSIQ